MSLFGQGTATKPTLPSAAMRVTQSLQGVCIPLVYGQARCKTNLIDYSGFSSRPASGGGKQGGKGGGGGGKGGGGTGSYNYSACIQFAVCEGPVAGFLQAWNGSSSASLAALNLTAGLGGYPQSPWSWKASAAPGQALSYNGIAWVAAAPFDLGGSPTTPNLTIEVLSSIANGIPGYPDADPSAVIVDLLTNPDYGVGYPAEYIGSLAVFQSMALAAGLVVSDGIVSQTGANTYLNDMADALNSAFVQSNGMLTLIPYGDTGSISGNGYSYTPPSVPLFSLTDDDYLPNQGGSSVGATSFSGDDPVIVARKRKSDLPNKVNVEYLDRYATGTDPTTGLTVADPYNPTLVSASDDASINAFGLKIAPTKTMHFFCVGAAAAMAANLQLRRLQASTEYSFTLGPQWIVLEPMDLIEISDSALGLSNQPVLIQEVTENSDGTISVVAQEYFGATTAIPAHASQPSLGFRPDWTAAPPTTNPPIVFAAPVALATNQGLEMWIGASGAAGWGGGDVYVSGDGTSYANVGRILGPARQGVTTSPFPAGTDPDTADVLAVDLSMSDATLLGGTVADADAAHTLCLVGSEFIAYSSATLVASNRYSLGGYIRRGLYGSSIAAHPAGTPFLRIDSQVFKYPYSPDKIGTTLYIKVLAFNNVLGGSESLADVEATEIVLPAPPPPPNVTGFGVTESNNVLSFKWNPVADYALAGYTLGYAPPGSTDRASFTPITVVGAGTEVTTAEVPAGNWRFGIWAVDIAGTPSPSIATADLTVTAQDTVTIAAEQSPLWPGSVSGFVRHYTGVLIPDDQHTMSSYLGGGWTTLLSTLVPTPVSTATYTTQVIDQGYDATNRVRFTVGTAALAGQTGTPSVAVAIDTWLTGGTDPASFVPWTVGYTPLRYIVLNLTYSGISAGSVFAVTEFEPIVDTGQPPVQYDQAATIAAGGSSVVFATAFHLAPTIQATASGSTPLVATVSAITATGCTVHVWNLSGTDVGGTVTLSLKGE